MRQINKTEYKVEGRLVCLLLSFFFLGMIQASGQAQINGNNSVERDSEEYYEATFEIAPWNQANIYWNVQNGQIIEENTNPTSGPIYCIVRWDGQEAEGLISIYEDLNGQEGSLTVRIAGDICGGGSSIPKQIPCGGSIQIGPYPQDQEYTYSWTPSAGLSDPTVAQPLASPSVTTRYTVVFTPKNLILNGDFENGYTGVNSDYQVMPASLSGSGPGSYSITANPALLGPTWCTSTGHGGGNAMVIDGYAANSKFWYTDVSVTRFRRYRLSFWVQVLSDNPPQIEVVIDGQSKYFSNSLAWLGSCNILGWVPIEIDFIAANNVARIELFNRNASYSGNDFSIDDISLTACDVSHIETVVVDGPLSISGNIRYYRFTDGSATYPTTDYYTDQISTCTTNKICFRMDEGDILFNMTSSEPTGNIWSITRNGSANLSDPSRTNWQNGSPIFNQQTFSPHFFLYWSGFIPFESEHTFVITLHNSVLGVSKSINVKVYPQYSLYPSCSDAVSPVGYANFAFEEPRQGAQYVWDLSNKPNPFDHTISTLPHASIVWDPSDVIQPFYGTYTRTDLTGCKTQQVIQFTNPWWDGCSGAGHRSVGRSLLIKDVVKSNFGIYPNPATRNLYLKSNKRIVAIRIYSFEGRLIKLITKHFHSSIDISKLPQGAYFIQALYSDDTKEAKSFIKN